MNKPDLNLLETVVLVFSDTNTEKIEGIAFTDLVALMFEEKYLENPPFKLFFPLINKVIFFHEYVLDKYLTSGKVDFNFLYETLAGDELYRNKTEIIANTSVVDPGTLWIKRGESCFVIDDDFIFEYPFDENLFKIANQ